MSDFDDLLRAHLKLQHTVEELRHQAANMMRVGTVKEVDGKKGYQVNFGNGDDGKPIPSAWFPHPEQGGAFKTWRPLTKDQIVYVVAPGGDQRQAFVIPRGGFSDQNPQPSEKLDENVDTYGKVRRETRAEDTVDKVGKAKVTKKAEGKITAETGDQPEGGGSGGNVAHELNRQLQGIKAHLTQHDNNIAGLHDATSKMREIAEKAIPGLMVLKPLLNSDPQSLEKAAQGIVGKLEGYVAKTMQGMIGKLTNGFMDNAMGLVKGFMGDQLGGILDQVEALASGEGIEAALGAAMQSAVSEARGMIDGAAGGSLGPLTEQLNVMAGIAAGTPLEGAFADLKGQLTGAIGAIGPIAAGLGDLVDNQKNLTKGLTRSYRLGGY
ncbi:MAG: hypothetical protein Q7T93_16615 [Methylobacterium sp.]|uniref:hypothetical protein n=1 Tax=Methylobacterium sp. TaxID=409 RepID=UPI0027288ECE|nr:hypothetical protein [Methylobacterium sp.]MDO9428441.1 hypothetical protein [Methylobacterium sp.]